jgi:hypothetical protein
MKFETPYLSISVAFGRLCFQWSNAHSASWTDSTCPGLLCSNSKFGGVIKFYFIGYRSNSHLTAAHCTDARGILSQQYEKWEWFIAKVAENCEPLVGLGKMKSCEKC